MTNQMLAVTDIEAMLKGLRNAIRLDQDYVDSLTEDQFATGYNDDLWRNWRRNMSDLIDRLLSSSDMSVALLKRLTDVATSFEPPVCGHVMLENLAEIVGGHVAGDNVTAATFLTRVADEIERYGPRKRLTHSARQALSGWFSLIDPLAISGDPECQYPVPMESQSTL